MRRRRDAGREHVMRRVVLSDMLTLDDHFEGTKACEIDWHEYR
jgi:hypothetical protein